MGVDDDDTLKSRRQEAKRQALKNIKKIAIALATQAAKDDHDDEVRARLIKSQNFSTDNDDP